MFPTISEIHFSVYGGTSTYCRRAEYEENSTPVPEGYLHFLYASSLFLQKYKALLSLEMGFVTNLREQT